MRMNNTEKNLAADHRERFKAHHPNIICKHFWEISITSKIKGLSNSYLEPSFLLKMFLMCICQSLYGQTVFME